MAIDGNFLAFLVPALLAALAAVVAFPSKRRIQEDPSTAYGGGRKAMVIIAAILAVTIGAVLAGLGSTQNVEVVVAGLNMVQIGGISLIVMAVALLAASAMVGRQIRMAARGESEQVLEVSAVPLAPPVRGAFPPRPNGPPPRGPPPRGPPARGPPARGPPARGPPPRGPPPRGPPPRDIPPGEMAPVRGVPPSRDLPPRPVPPPRDGAPPPPRRVERRPPPPRYSE